MTTVAHKPTAEQSAILDFMQQCQANLMIRALAGTGKSATLLMIDKASKIRPILYLVFNTANAEKATKEFSSTTMVKTFNSIGHKVWGDTCAHPLKLNRNKFHEIFLQKLDGLTRSEFQDFWEVYDQVRDGVSMAKALGYIPANHPKGRNSLCEDWTLWDALDEPPSPLAKELITQILEESIRQAYCGIIDFNDQCYMGALFGGVFPRFPLVLVDEYQDLSPVQHALLAKLCKHSRQIGVGDDAQSIYGFRGAVANGILKAMRLFDMEEKSLTVSFRCPTAIVDNVRWRVPDFKASKLGGSVRKGSQQIKDNSTVICRNNAPLLAQAMAMLYSGRSVNVSGVDISKKLLKQMTKLGHEDLTKVQALDRVELWEAKKEASGAKNVRDMADCMRVFIARAASLGGAIAIARHAFEQSGAVQFMTGHKAKGLEFDRVYHLRQDLLLDGGQDHNLRYVIDTRTTDELIYI